MRLEVVPSISQTRALSCRDWELLGHRAVEWVGVPFLRSAAAGEGPSPHRAGDTTVPLGGPHVSSGLASGGGVQRGPFPSALVPTWAQFCVALPFPQVIQVPQGKYKVLPTERTKVSSYPVALIPGQFQEYYKRWVVVLDRPRWMLGHLRPLEGLLRVRLSPSHALSKVCVRALPPGSVVETPFSQDLLSGGASAGEAPSLCTSCSVGRLPGACACPAALESRGSGGKAGAGTAQTWGSSLQPPGHVQIKLEQPGFACTAATPLPWPSLAWLLSIPSPSRPWCNQDQH